MAYGTQKSMSYEVQPRASYCTQLIVWEHQAYGL
jgi:hypothetical protein